MLQDYVSFVINQVGTKHSDAFLHICGLGDEITTSHTFAIVSGHAIETDLLLETVYLFKSFVVLDVGYQKPRAP